MRGVFMGVGLIVAVFVIAPIAVVVPMSFSTSPSLEFPPPSYWLGHYRAFFANVTWTGPTINSFVIGLGTMILTLVLVTPAAFAMVRHRFRGRGLINLLLLTPLVVPHIVMAVGYYSYFGRLGLLQSYMGVILAHTCLTAPLVFLTVSASLKGFDRNLERAAQSLGAPPIVAFLTVTLPVLRPAFLVAALLSFVHSFDETTVALFISGRDVATLPKRMFDAIRLQADPVLSVAATLLFTLVLAAFAGLGIYRLLTARRARMRLEGAAI
jgi:putative spermidine/putrescine transport system permease protein